MAKKPITVYYSEQCNPCHEVTDRLKNGRFASDLGEECSVEMIDVTSEEGFAAIEKEELTKIPAAKYQGKFCQLEIDTELDAVMITCLEENMDPAETTVDEKGDSPVEPESGKDIPAPNS